MMPQTRSELDAAWEWFAREDDGEFPYDVSDAELLRQYQAAQRQAANRRYIWRVVIALVAAGIILTLLAVGAMPAGAHSWYDGLCCNESDCRQTTLGEIERHDDGWYVVPTRELIPFGDLRLKRSLDPLIHRCVKPNDATRCLYVPEQGG